MRARYDVRGGNERMRAKGGLQYIGFDVLVRLRGALECRVSWNSASLSLRPLISLALALLGIYHAGIDPRRRCMLSCAQPGSVWSRPYLSESRTQ